jgi:hypothetical protein
MANKQTTAQTPMQMPTIVNIDRMGCNRRLFAPFRKVRSHIMV